MIPGGHGRSGYVPPPAPAGIVERRCARPQIDHRAHGPYVRGDEEFMCPGGPPDPLVMITIADRGLAAARRDLDDAVLVARIAGHSYADIGAALGVSRQAAWERFHKLEDQAS